MLLEFLADYLLQTPIFEDPTKKLFYPAGTTAVPTATKIITPLTIAPAGSDCGVDLVKSQIINLAANAGSDETVKLAGALLESLSNINLGIAVAGVNIAIGDATTLQNMAKTFIEVVTRRAIYALGTDVFMAARTSE